MENIFCDLSTFIIKNNKKIINKIKSYECKKY